MQARELAKKIQAGGQAPCVLDVRSGFEFNTGHIPGAAHAPFLKILLRRVALPREKQALIVLTCEHGPRAYLARTLLGLIGYRNLHLLDGHMAVWRRAGLPLERE
jgi:hydroxyacylglutathione hydrolase